jgi:hypothetical protein
MSVKMKPWNMQPQTRIIVSQAIKLCKELNETYGQKVTVRQIYYHLFSKGIIQLTQNDYEKVSRHITKARKRGYIPFQWIEDRSRNLIFRWLYDDVPHFLDQIMYKYRRNTWNQQDNFVIILVEKQALGSIIWDIAKEFNVPVFPTKGFSSWSMFTEDIRDLTEYFGLGKNLIVLVLSDMDPSGKHIKEDYQNKFKFMTEELGFTKPHIIEKIAVTDEQVQKYNLPPMKKKYRNKGILDIWELDALDPKILRSVVKESIEKYIDLAKLQKDFDSETKELEFLEYLVKMGESYLSNKGERK